MDSLSHSRQPSKSSAALSKKVCNGSGNLMSRTTYDDVFGGPPKFGPPTLAPRLEDYSEIFGGFHAPRATSIPVLDLPSLDEEEVFFDVRSSSFDYNEVFGGFDDLDFAVSIDELVMGPSNGVDGDLNSSDEAWTPLETESVSEVSDRSGKNRSLSSRDSFESIDGHMEFNISYHRANQRSDEDLSTGITHVTQLDAVPAYTFLVDKTTPSKRTDNDNPPLEVSDDDNIHMEFSGGSVKEKNLRKTMSQQSNGSSIEQTLGNGHRTKREYRRNISLPNESFITISEISLRTAPSELPPPRRPPPLVDTKKGDTTRVDKNGKTTSSEGSNGDTSPPFFDVEVDMSSSAAASAAAMKEAMDKAEVKLKSAKEQLERKRECVQSRKTGRKDKDEKLVGNIGGTSYINGDREHATCGKKETGMESSIREERLKIRRKTKMVSESLDGEKLFDLSQTLAENRRQSEEMETDEWKQATQFFELVRNDRSLKASGPPYDEEILMLDTKDHRCRHKERGAENEKKSKVAKELCEQQESSASETSKASYQHKGLEKQVKVSQEVCEQREYDNNFRAAQYPMKIEKKAAGADVSGPFENWVKASSVEYEKPMKHHEKEQPVDVPVKSMEQKFKISRDKEDSERKQRKSLVHNENGTKHKETLVQVENDKKLKEEKERKERRSKEILEWEESFKRQKEAQEREEVEKRTRETLKQTQNEKRLKEVGEKKHGETIYLEENERILKEAREQEDSDKMQKDAWEREENENRLNEADQNEENEKNQRVAHKRERTENGLRKTHEVEKMDRRLDDTNEKEESRKRLEQACDERYNSKMFKEVKEREECDMASEKCFEKQMKHASEESRVHTEKKLEDAGNAEDLKRVNKAHRKRWGEENWKGLKMAEGPQVHSEEEELHAPDEMSMLGGDQNLDETKLGCQHENHEMVPGSEVTYYEENGRIQTEPRDSDIESEAAKTTYVRDDETSELSGLAEDNLEHDEDRVQLEDDVEIHCPDGSVKTRGDLGIDIELDKTNSASHMASDKMNTGKKLAAEHGEGESNIKHAQTNLNQKENKDKVMQTRVTKDIQNGRKMNDAEPSVLGGKRITEETAQWANVTKNADRKENNINVKLTSEQREAERIKREKELEAERLRKMEEEWEREREREKDRMAVDRATLEARERTFSEARERAEKAAFERATAEARNRAMTEARERLEKACAEAREKSLADKASMEARLRAERAAVERATAEARERAIEKVMAERAAFEAKERLERTFSEKFSASSRNNSMRPSSSSSDQQDKKFQNSASFSDSRYHYSSAYDASYNAERNYGVEGESAQRCKARLERHRRTAERAAKALAEKNMRDLLAQREQAERNRLAETLDADVKRWSSGKEGNLRALLSTLQYILGPESGWHPIPLTEVITSAAVKKAYRKATLCVHPDKLQQRGATIQQKYISEKVFDLLKEAWNKFNSEER